MGDDEMDWRALYEEMRNDRDRWREAAERLLVMSNPRPAYDVDPWWLGPYCQPETAS